MGQKCPEPLAPSRLAAQRMIAASAAAMPPTAHCDGGAKVNRASRAPAAVRGPDAANRVASPAAPHNHRSVSPGRSKSPPCVEVPDVDALASAVRVTADIIGGVPSGSGGATTPCPDYDVDALVAHALSAPVLVPPPEEVKVRDDEIEDTIQVVDAVDAHDRIGAAAKLDQPRS